MAQHDYTIANQGFPATRADINNALSAIATNNSGTSAPSTQYAGQFWIDTTTSTWTMYIHDGADDIQFATIDTSTNTINFIDSALANDVVINTSGDITTTGAFTSVGIDDNATSTAITIDSSENVGIGTASPATKLNVEGTSVIAEFKSTNNNNVLRIKGNNATNGVVLGSTSSDDFIFTTNTTERMRIENSSGNVGIGTSSPTATLDVNGGLNCGFLQSSSNIYATSGIFRSSDGSATFPSIQPGVDSNTGFFRPATDTIGFSTAGSERMRIDSSGGVRINATGALFNSNAQEKFTVDAGATGQAGGMSATQSGFPVMYLEHHNSGSQYILIFRQGTPSSQVGSIQVNGGSSTSFVTTSDYRLKENVNYDFDATTRLKQLRPARFNFISDADTTVDGFLAHEVQEVVPEAISGEKDAVNEDGSINPQGIDQSKLVPLLVKTIQELEARITALETTN